MSASSGVRPVRTSLIGSARKFWSSVRPGLGQQDRGSGEAIVQQVVGQIPWGHNVQLLDLVEGSRQTSLVRRSTIVNGWSRKVLVLHLSVRCDYKGAKKTYPENRVSAAVGRFLKTIASQDRTPLRGENPHRVGYSGGSRPRDRLHRTGLQSRLQLAARNLASSKFLKERCLPSWQPYGACVRLRTTLPPPNRHKESDCHFVGSACSLHRRKREEYLAVSADLPDIWTRTWQ